jgi:hypothetical protein
MLDVALADCCNSFAGKPPAVCPCAINADGKLKASKLHVCANADLNSRISHLPSGTAD